MMRVRTIEFALGEGELADLSRVLGCDEARNERRVPFRCRADEVAPLC